jgi:hypothetical protein
MGNKQATERINRMMNVNIPIEEMEKKETERKEEKKRRTRDEVKAPPAAGEGTQELRRSKRLRTTEEKIERIVDEEEDIDEEVEEYDESVLSLPNNYQSAGDSSDESSEEEEEEVEEKEQKEEKEEKEEKKKEKKGGEKLVTIPKWSVAQEVKRVFELTDHGLDYFDTTIGNTCDLCEGSASPQTWLCRKCNWGVCMYCFYEMEKWEKITEGKRSERKGEVKIDAIRFIGPRPGPNTRVTDPLHLFSLFLPDTCIDSIVDHTNAYIATLDLKVPCDPTTVDEFRAFLGMNLFRGLLVNKDTPGYWSGSTQSPFMMNIMSCLRFRQLNSHWHVADPKEVNPKKGEAGHNVWHKVQHLLTQFNVASAVYFDPYHHLTVDEQMVPFQGRFVGVQYMKGKPTKWGIKLFVVACAKTSYILKVEPYAGKGKNKPEAGVNDRLVLRICEPWLNKGYTVVADNHFTSLSLVKLLLEQKTGYVGTLRRGRKGMPLDLWVKDKSMARGMYIVYRSGNLVVIAWQDRVVVFFLSSCCPPFPPATVQRRTKEKKEITVGAPPVHAVYQTNMRGVDVADQQLSSYRPGSQTKRWWVVLAWHIINLMVHNAYIVHKLNAAAAGTKPITNREFRLKLAEQLVHGWSSRKRAGRPSQTLHGINHQLVKFTNICRCVECGLASTGGKIRRTWYGCVTCGVHVHSKCFDKHCEKT